MKYLENIGLENISKLINQSELGGGLALHGRVETYSMKRTTDEKKHAKQLESKLMTEARAPNDGTPKQIPEKVIKLPYVDLVQTLNAAQSDFDFSQLQPESFRFLPMSEAVQTINNSLAELTVRCPAFLVEMWKEIDTAMEHTLSVSCEAYILVDSSQVDDLEDGIVWSYHYFFCSKDARRICYFTVNARSSYRDGCHSDDDDEDMDVDIEEINSEESEDGY
jgi:hypothetical protein